MGMVKDAKFYGDLCRALGATPYQRLHSGSATSSLIMKAVDDETLKAVYVTMVSIPRSGVTAAILEKNWVEEGLALVKKGLKTVAKEYLKNTGGDTGPVFEVDEGSVQTGTEMTGYHTVKGGNSGMFRAEFLVRVRKPGS